MLQHFKYLDVTTQYIYMFIPYFCFLSILNLQMTYLFAVSFFFWVFFVQHLYLFCLPKYFLNLATLATVLLPAVTALSRQRICLTFFVSTDGESSKKLTDRTHYSAYNLRKRLTEQARQVVSEVQLMMNHAIQRRTASLPVSGNGQIAAAAKVISISLEKKDEELRKKYV